MIYLKCNEKNKEVMVMGKLGDFISQDVYFTTFFDAYLVIQDGRVIVGKEKENGEPDTILIDAPYNKTVISRI